MTPSTPRIVRIAAPGDALLRALAEQRPPQQGWTIAALAGTPEPGALVILDLDTGEAQRDWIDRLRGEGFAGPVVILGDDGAARSPDDEPLTRPVRLGALLARLDAHVAEPGGTAAITLGPYDFLPVEHLLRHRGDGGAIRLTELERRLLASLAEASGAIVGREDLLSKVWGYSASVSTHTVETHIWRLRQKIETEDPTSRFLRTEVGGYRIAQDGEAEGAA